MICLFLDLPKNYCIALKGLLVSQSFADGVIARNYFSFYLCIYFILFLHPGAPNAF